MAYVGFNALSIAGQLSASTVVEALLEVLRHREAAKRRGAVLHGCRSLLGRPAAGTTTLRDLLNRLPNSNTKRSFLAWITRDGPFWDDDREHSGDTWLEWNGELVTDTVVGEAAYRAESLKQRGAPDAVALTSLRHSVFVDTSLCIERVTSETTRVAILVRNFCDVNLLDRWLASCEPPITSWSELECRAKNACARLYFAPEAFRPLMPHPFHGGVAERLLERLRVLDEIRGCCVATGLDERGQQLHRLHFEGDKAWFSDSSAGEKVDFASELTFPHPERPAERLFCPWHGKVKTPQYRLHHSWPPTADTPLYVVYVGPKITKR